MRYSLLALAVLAACEPAPNATPPVEEIHQALSYGVLSPGPLQSILGTPGQGGFLTLSKRINYDVIWDTILQGGAPNAAGMASRVTPAGGAPPAASIVCPDMNVEIWSDNGYPDGGRSHFAPYQATGYQEWVGVVQPIRRSIKSVTIVGDGYLFAPSITGTEYCEYQACAPGSTSSYCAPMAMGLGWHTVWMWPVCPDPSKPLGGIPEFNGTRYYAWDGATYIYGSTPPPSFLPAPPADKVYRVAMPTWNGPWGQKRMWRDFAAQCGLSPGPQWYNDTDYLVQWCVLGVSTPGAPSGGCTLRQVDRVWTQ